jgi:hypothetical protein
MINAEPDSSVRELYQKDTNENPDYAIWDNIFKVWLKEQRFSASSL